MWPDDEREGFHGGVIAHKNGVARAHQVLDQRVVVEATLQRAIGKDEADGIFSSTIRHGVAQKRSEN